MNNQRKIINFIKLESNVFFIEKDVSLGQYVEEELCMIRTNENMLNVASDNQVYLDIPCLSPVANVSPPEGSVCWTAGWGDYRTTDANGLDNWIHNQEQSSILQLESNISWIEFLTCKSGYMHLLQILWIQSSVHLIHISNASNPIQLIV